MNSNCKKIMNLVIILLLLVTLLLNIYSLCNKKSPLNIEILKAGGKENWNIMKQIYESDYYINLTTSEIDAQFAEVNGAENSSDEENNTQSDEDVKILVEDILSTRPVRGDKDARFTILEYTELHCPYCQRHSQSNTINDVLKAFPEKVNSVSMHYIIHGEDALNLAAAMECVAELKSDKFYDVFEEAFNAYPVNMDWLVDIATKLWVNKNDLQSCIDEWRYTKAVEDMMDQWKTVFGVKWTPGNVIIDRETWKFQLIPGAYPADSFIEALNNMWIEE